MSFPKGRHLDSIAYGRKTSYDSGLHRAIRRSTDNLVTTRYARIPNITRQGPMTLTRVDDCHSVLRGISRKSEALVVERIPLVGCGHSQILGNGN
jgi:hypothetical protein